MDGYATDRLLDAASQNNKNMARVIALSKRQTIAMEALVECGRTMAGLADDSDVDQWNTQAEEKDEEDQRWKAEVDAKLELLNKTLPLRVRPAFPTPLYEEALGALSKPVDGKIPPQGDEALTGWRCRGDGWRSDAAPKGDGPCQHPECVRCRVLDEDVTATHAEGCSGACDNVWPCVSFQQGMVAGRDEGYEKGSTEGARQAAECTEHENAAYEKGHERGRTVGAHEADRDLTEGIEELRRHARDLYAALTDMVDGVARSVAAERGEVTP
jgi:hypothetical protein